VLFSFFKLNAQTYNYSYTDPCTGNIKNLIVPINGSVTVGYYGFVENFTQQQFTDGTFETWANQVFSQYDGSPCSEIVGLGGQINIAQDVTLNTVGLLNSLSSLMDLSNGATDFLSGSLAAASNSSNTNNGNKKNGNSSQNGSGNNTTNNSNNTTTNTNNTTTNNNQNVNNGTSNTTEGSQTTSGTNETSSNGGNGTTNQNGGTQNPTPAGGTTTQGGSNENGNQQAQSPINQNQNGNENNGNNNLGGNTGGTSGNGNTGNGENPNGQRQQGQEGSVTQTNGGGTGGNNETPNTNQETTQTEESGGGQTNITQGATKTVNQNKEGGKPTVIASSDFVGFNFQNSEVRTGLKLTGGYHNLRWDGQTARGGMMDYVSAQKGPNMTGYHAWINKKSMTLLSGTLSVGFEGRGSLYGTIAAGQMFTFPKVKGLKAVYMGTVSYGQVYKTEFLGTALIGGGMYDLKAGKRFDIKLMGLFVYAPYVSYYNDLVLKSPYVVLPSIGTNISITKRFKFNINAGGAWAIKENALNYTVTCGTRLLVGQ
jgi:hypothetical protein